jgi:hypothetical protein
MVDQAYLTDLIEQIVDSKIGNMSNTEATTPMRADNGEFMELDATNDENVASSVATWPIEELWIDALKGKHDPDGDGTALIPPEDPPAP